MTSVFKATSRIDGGQLQLKCVIDLSAFNRHNRAQLRWHRLPLEGREVDVLAARCYRYIYRARWTADIHCEWIENLLENEPHRLRADLERTRDRMDRATRGALVTGYESLIGAVELRCRLRAAFLLVGLFSGEKPPHNGRVGFALCVHESATYTFIVVERLAWRNSVCLKPRGAPVFVEPGAVLRLDLIRVIVPRRAFACASLRRAPLRLRRGDKAFGRVSFPVPLPESTISSTAALICYRRHRRELGARPMMPLHPGRLRPVTRLQRRPLITSPTRAGKKKSPPPAVNEYINLIWVKPPQFW